MQLGWQQATAGRGLARAIWLGPKVMAASNWALSSSSCFIACSASGRRIHTLQKVVVLTRSSDRSKNGGSWAVRGLEGVAGRVRSGVAVDRAWGGCTSVHRAGVLGSGAGRGGQGWGEGLP